MDSEIAKLIAKLEIQRREAMDFLLTLSDNQLGLSYTDSSQGEEGSFTIRRLIHRISTHHYDHLQHILKERRNIENPRSETARELAEIQVARAELIAALIGLSNEDLEQDISHGEELGNLEPRSDSPPNYTLRRLVEHVVEMEEMRLGHIRQALEGGNA